MSWPQAKIEALRLVEEIAAQRGEPVEIQLALYATESCYLRYKPTEPWPWSFHTQVVRSTYRELLKRGLNAKLVKYE